MIDLARLPTEALRALSDAGDEVLDCYRSAAAEGIHLCEPLFRARPYRVDVKYPEPKGARDPVSDARYYFHVHPGETTGHFHTFLGCASGYTHLAAIALDAFGLPVELFTVNRRVAADVFQPAGELCRRLGDFTLAHSEPATPNVDRWLSATLRLFRPQIEALLAERDAIFEAHRRAGSDPLEDQRLESPSRVAVDLDEHIAAVARALSGNSRTSPRR